jgi:uncharacterized protein (DUF2342 family)
LNKKRTTKITITSTDTTALDQSTDNTAIDQSTDNTAIDQSTDNTAIDQSTDNTAIDQSTDNTAINCSVYCCIVSPFTSNAQSIAVLSLLSLIILSL